MTDNDKITYPKKKKECNFISNFYSRNDSPHYYIKNKLRKKFKLELELKFLEHLKYLLLWQNAVFGKQNLFKTPVWSKLANSFLSQSNHIRPITRLLSSPRCYKCRTLPRSVLEARIMCVAEGPASNIIQIWYRLHF
jgi:hypothetical protein